MYKYQAASKILNLFQGSPKLNFNEQTKLFGHPATHLYVFSSSNCSDLFEKQISGSSDIVNQTIVLPVRTSSSCMKLPTIVYK